MVSNSRRISVPIGLREDFTDGTCSIHYSGSILIMVLRTILNNFCRSLQSFAQHHHQTDTHHEYMEDDHTPTRRTSGVEPTTIGLRGRCDHCHLLHRHCRNGSTTTPCDRCREGGVLCKFSRHGSVVDKNVPGRRVRIGIGNCGSLMVGRSLKIRVSWIATVNKESQAATKNESDAAPARQNPSVDGRSLMVGMSPKVRVSWSATVNKASQAAIKNEGDAAPARQNPNVDGGSLMVGMSLKIRVSWSATVNKESRVATNCLLYTSPSPRDGLLSRMPSSA